MTNVELNQGRSTQLFTLVGIRRGNITKAARHCKAVKLSCSEHKNQNQECLLRFQTSEKTGHQWTHKIDHESSVLSVYIIHFGWLTRSNCRDCSNNVMRNPSVRFQSNFSIGGHIFHLGMSEHWAKPPNGQFIYSEQPMDFGVRYF